MRLRYLPVVPARGGSKRLPGKNSHPLAGKPLITYTIEAALGAGFDPVYVSTDDEKIEAISRESGAWIPVLRPSSLAQDETSTLEVLQHVLEEIEKLGTEADNLILLQPTSPLRTATDVRQAVQLYDSSGADTLVSVCEAKPHPYYAWRLEGPLVRPLFGHDKMSASRAELPPIVYENGAIYILRSSDIRAGRFYGDRVAAFKMEEKSSVDIDTKFDLLLAERWIGQVGHE